MNISIATAQRKCAECGDTLRGRNDMRFCSSECRTSHHNRLRFEAAKQSPECIATIQKAILKNHKILASLKDSGQGIIGKMDLAEMGFSFRFVTSFKQTDGKMILCCFNMGYIVSNDEVLILPEPQFN